jgi:hypothetical protein
MTPGFAKHDLGRCTGPKSMDRRQVLWTGAKSLCTSLESLRSAPVSPSGTES